MLQTHNNPEAFPETADIETASDDYAGRFAGAVGDNLIPSALLRVLSKWNALKAKDKIK